MSTRAVYSFIDEHETHHVYKHHDGYPKGAAEFIEKAKIQAWPFPRFEASDFGAAFVATNKEGPGGVRLTHGFDQHGDLAFRYEVRFVNGELEVTTFNPSNQIFKGTLAEFQSFAAGSSAWKSTASTPDGPGPAGEMPGRSASTSTA